MGRKSRDSDYCIGERAQKKLSIQGIQRTNLGCRLRLGKGGNERPFLMKEKPKPFRSKYRGRKSKRQLGLLPKRVRRPTKVGKKGGAKGAGTFRFFGCKG